MKRDKIVIGSRESKLAVLQSEMVRDYIKGKIRIWKWKSSL
ncbi:Porphobilinogen deaminase, dipyromethane cofactor binding domain [Ruminococcus sp. SR1/5]|nr:Porphobilinogen deaminase, dipyromethane cofactor binding domain [Ruminococcus sp. SR1/5]